MQLTEILKRFEHFVVKALLLMMGVVVFLSTLELAYILIKDILKPPILILEIDDLLELFGMFLLVLIGLELFDSIQVYHEDRIIRVEVVIMVAIIAVARKVIIVDYKSLSSLTLLEFGFGILCLGLTYLLLKAGRFPFIKLPWNSSLFPRISAEGGTPEKHEEREQENPTQK